MQTLFKVPMRVHHGLLLITDLAERFEAGTPMSLEEIANKEKISQGFLEEIASRLRSAKLIKGKRGAGGGYVLTHDPKDITVANVITAIEGERLSVECLGDSGAEALADKDPHGEIWRKVQGQVMATLYGMTIKDVLWKK